jgi:hypothetical protein
VQTVRVRVSWHAGLSSLPRIKVPRQRGIDVRDKGRGVLEACKACKVVSELQRKGRARFLSLERGNEQMSRFNVRMH